MFAALKIAVGLLFGLFAFVLPAPIGGDALFGLLGRVGVFAGIVLGLAVYFLRGRERLTQQFRVKSRAAQVVGLDF